MNSTDQSDDDVRAFSSIVAALRPLERANQLRLLQTIARFLGLDSPTVSNVHGTSNTVSPPGPYSADRTISPKQFLVTKQPKTDVERVACLAYYLAHFKDTPHFKTLDISKLNTEAAQPKFANAAYSVENATKTGYLVPAIKGNKQLSAAGEHFVTLLPDRDAAKAAMTNFLRRRNKRRSRREADETGE